MDFHRNIRMLNAANRRLQRARRFLKLERLEHAEYDILAAKVILSGTLNCLNSCKKTKNPRKLPGKRKNE